MTEGEGACVYAHTASWAASASITREKHSYLLEQGHALTAPTPGQKEVALTSPGTYSRVPHYHKLPPPLPYPTVNYLEFSQSEVLPF